MALRDEYGDGAVETFMFNSYGYSLGKLGPHNFEQLWQKISRTVTAGKQCHVLERPYSDIGQVVGLKSCRAGCRLRTGISNFMVRMAMPGSTKLSEFPIRTRTVPAFTVY